MMEPERRRAQLRPVEQKPEPDYDRAAARQRVLMLTVREAGYTWRTVDDYVRLRGRER